MPIQKENETTYSLWEVDEKYLPKKKTLIGYADNYQEAIGYLQNNEGGLFQDELHKLSFYVEGANKMESLLKCEFCGEEVTWNGYSYTNGHIWECEECNRLFCSSCSEKQGGDYNGKNVLCPYCNITKGEKRQIA